MKSKSGNSRGSKSPKLREGILDGELFGDETFSLVVDDSVSDSLDEFSSLSVALSLGIFIFGSVDGVAYIIKKIQKGIIRYRG